MGTIIEREPFTFERQTNFGEFDDDGFPASPQIENGSGKGNIQPVSGNEILQVPEGDRTRQLLNIYTATELRHEDVVIRKGIRYEVQLVEDWTMSGDCISYFKVRVVKIDVSR